MKRLEIEISVDNTNHCVSDIRNVDCTLSEIISILGKTYAQLAVGAVEKADGEVDFAKVEELLDLMGPMMSESAKRQLVSTVVNMRLLP